MNINIIIIIFLILTNSPSTKDDQIIFNEYNIFTSQEECERQSKKSCTFQSCDYIPGAKDYQEVCGDFGTGWIPIKN